MQYLVLVAGVVLLLLAWAVGQMVLPLLRLRLKLPTARLAQREELPEELAPIFAAPERALTSLGFHYSHTERGEGPLLGPDEVTWALAFVEPTSKTYAYVMRSKNPASAAPWTVLFASFCEDGRQLLTTDGFAHLMFPVPDYVALEDSYAADLHTTFAHHRGRVEALRETLLLSAEDTVAQSLRYNLDSIRLGEDNGHLRRTADGNYAPTLRFTLGYLRQVLRGQRRLAKAIAGRTPTTAGDDDNELQQFEDFLHQQRQKPASSWVFKAGLLIGSVLLFALAFSIDFSLEFVAMLVGVLFVHELGHYLGMRAFGYRDVKILFIPLLGAATVGHAEGVPAWQRVVVYLLGPVPGIVIGGFCVWWATATGSPTLLSLGTVFLILNYINLLPILPLDGGHVVRTLIFDRFPLAGFGFFLLSVAALGAFAWTADEPVLWFLFLFSLVGIPIFWRDARLVSRFDGVRAQQPAGDRQARLQMIFALLREPQFSKLVAHAKFAKARELLERAELRLPGLGTVIPGLGLYLALLVGVPVAAILTNQDAAAGLAMRFGMFDDFEPSPDWEARIAAAEEPQQRWQLTMDAADWYSDDYASTAAADFYRQAAELAATLPSEPLRYRAEALFGLATVSGDDTHHAEAIALWRQHYGDNSAEVAKRLIDRAWLRTGDESADPPGLRDLQQALSIYQQLEPVDPGEVGSAHRALGQWYTVYDDRAAADDHYREALRNYQAAYPPASRQLVSLVIEVGGYYLEDGRPAETRALYRKVAPPSLARGNSSCSTEASPSQWAQLETQHGWAAFVQDDLRGAQLAFSEAIRYQKAEDWYSAWQMVPNYLDLAATMHRLGNTAAADQTLQTARQALEESDEMGWDALLAVKERSREHATGWRAKREEAHLEVLGSSR